MSAIIKELDLNQYEEVIKGFQLGDKKIIIMQDICSEDPLNWGHFEFFSCHRRYYRDKKHKVIREKNGCFASATQFDSLEEIEKFLIDNEYLYQHVYLYEHSGLKLWTSMEKQSYNSIDMFFDGGCFGFLYVSKQQLRQDYKVRRITKKIQEQVYSHMNSFVSNEWEHYLNGDVYQYKIINSNNEIEDSAYGFYNLRDIREELNREHGIQIPKIEY